MFKNIGKKIQGISKIMFAIGVFFSIIMGALVFVIVDSLLFTSEAQTIAGMFALVVIAGGVILAWLGQILLFAYGKIAESCEATMKIAERMEKMQIAQIPSRKCASCGAALDEDAVFCPECGARNDK